MSDRWVVALAACAAVGALRPTALPVALGLLLLVAAVAARQPAVLCMGMVALTSALGARSLAGLDELSPGPIAGEVTLLSDPEPALGGLRADVRMRGRRLELRATSASAEALRSRLAGERVMVRGETQALPVGAPWLTARHIAGRLRVHAVESWRPGGPLSRAANALRRTLANGAVSLPTAQRSLYTGLVIGDDREQPLDLADDFRGAGLTHLLAVSGQNVAFVLVLAGPLLRRLRLWPRLIVTLAVVAMFGLVTRFEPSVMRAAGMAAIATTLATIGSPARRIRVLALTVTALLLVDPLLVRSVGFLLSVAASAGIVVLAPRLVSTLPGGRALREALAVTVAAQMGVAPVLVASFGPLPVAAIPANLMAAPAAGPVMVWGLTGGIVAGVFGGSLAEIVHVPTRPLLTWVAEVARRAAALPLGEMRAPHLVCLAVGIGLACVVPRLRRAGLLVVMGAVVAATLSAHAPPPLRSVLAPGVVRWHAGSTEVVVLGGAGTRSPATPAATLAALRGAGVRSIDLLVVADATTGPGVVAAIEDRHPLGAIVTAAIEAPPGAQAPVVIAPRPAASFAVGELQVRLTQAADRLVVEAAPRAPP